MFARPKPDVSAVIARLESKRDVDDQKSRDMHERAVEAARQGRKANVRSFLAQKKTHDAASAQYSALISTLVQQQAVADIAAAHTEIADVLRGMKGGALSTANIDHAADVADMVETAQSELGGLGGAMFQGGDDLDEMVAQLMATPVAEADRSQAAIPSEPTLDLPPAPSSPPSAADLNVDSLPAVFSSMMSGDKSGDQKHPRHEGAEPSKFKFTL